MDSAAGVVQDDTAGMQIGRTAVHHLVPILHLTTWPHLVTSSCAALQMGLHLAQRDLHIQDILYNLGHAFQLKTGLVFKS